MAEKPAIGGIRNLVAGLQTPDLRTLPAENAEVSGPSLNNSRFPGDQGRSSVAKPVSAPTKMLI
jgi:hypothetical protein